MDTTTTTTRGEILLNALCETDDRIGALADGPPDHTAQEVVDICLMVATEHTLTMSETAYLIATRLLDGECGALGSDWAMMLAARVLERVPKDDPLFWVCDNLTPLLYAPVT